MLSKTALLVAAASSAAVTSAVDVDTGYMSVFFATNGAGTSAACTDNGAPVYTKELTVGVCSSGIVTPAATVYALLSDCSTDNSAWSVTVHLDSACSGTTLFTTSADDACDCGAGSLGGSQVGVRISCGASQNNCYWYQQYDGSVCDDSSDATTDTSGYYISGDTCVDTNTEAMEVTCLGGTSSSAWNASIFEPYVDPRLRGDADAVNKNRVLATACGAPERTVVYGSSCDTCGTEFGDDAYADGSTFKVNCGGFDPTVNYMCDTNKPPSMAPSAQPGDDAPNDDAYGGDEDDDRSSASAPFAASSDAILFAGSMAALSAVFLM